MNHETNIDNKEIIKILQNTKAGKLISLVLHDSACYTDSGRLNKSFLMRKLGVKRKEIDKLINIAEEKYRKII